MKHLIPILWLLLIATATAAQKPTDKRLAGMDTLVQRLLKEWHAPGVGIAVVEKNKVVYAGGFGFRDYENKLPADGNTLFAIGSCTKAFTSALLGNLQNEGKLKWDEKAKTYLPEVAFYNDLLTNNITVRDLTCHRTGIPRHDYSWYLNPTTRDSLVMRIQYHENFADLRERWYYNNFMFLLQGVITERITGETWERNIQKHFFEPLGMKTSNFTLWDGKHNNAAKGYEIVKDSIIKKKDYYKIEGMGPAGSIFSSPVEMANWVLTWVNGGKWNGKEILPEAYVREAITSQMVVGAALPNADNPDVQFSNYGMGWFLQSYRGHYMVQHGGNIDGFSAMTAFYPSDSIGIVVLVNQNGSPLPGMIRNYIADKMLNLPHRDWHQQLKKAMAEAKAAAKQAEAAQSDNRKQGTRPSHLLAEYAGQYEHPGYGAFHVSVRNDSLMMSFRNKSADSWLEHYHYNVFRPKFLTDDSEENNSPIRVSFNIDMKGDIESATLVGVEPALEKLIFKKQAVAVAVAKADLESYLGEYEMAGMAARVYLRGENMLMLFVPGQPDYETVPIGNHEFKLKVLDGYSIRFEMNADGKAGAVYFIQPNGTFKAMRK
ncbi:MAG TPA: serine hydrolase [Saprospiraceae bacterium]|nr:serine hydrolase [Saprospiraceae bacterium]HMP24060.1 serine hydrolase [Saprospiraceae bacterium]